MKKRRMGIIVIILLLIITALLLFIVVWLVLYPCNGYSTKLCKTETKPTVFQVHCQCDCSCACDTQKHEAKKITTRITVPRPKKIVAKSSIEETKVTNVSDSPSIVVFMVVEVKSQPPPESKKSEWVDCRPANSQQEKQPISLSEIWACGCK